MRSHQQSSKRLSLNAVRVNKQTPTKRDFEQQNTVSTTDNTPVIEKPTKGFKALRLPRISRLSHVTSDSASAQPNKKQINRSVCQVTYKNMNSSASDDKLNVTLLTVQNDIVKAESAQSESVNCALLLRLELLRTLESGYQIVCLKSLN